MSLTLSLKGVVGFLHPRLLPGHGVSRLGPPKASFIANCLLAGPKDKKLRTVNLNVSSILDSLYSWVFCFNKGKLTSRLFLF